MADESPIEHDDVVTIMETLFDIRKSTDEILRLLRDENDEEEEEEE